MSDLLNYTTAEVVADYDRLRDDCALIELADFGLFELTGEDRKGWLQGQVTQNLRTFDEGTSTAFCFCEPTGHLISVCDGWAVQGKILFTAPVATVANVSSRIEQMVVLESVEHQVVTKKYKLLSIQGPRATAVLSEFVNFPNLDSGVSELDGAEIFVLRSNRTGMGGWDLWIPATKRKAISRIRTAFRTVGEAAYRLAALEAGRPRFGVDMNSRTLPLEMGAAFTARHVSLNKGCYVGQEVLQRIHSRGHTNRTWVGLVASSPIQAGQAVGHLRKADVGTITSAGFSPDYGHIGAAMLRNEAAYEREVVRVQTDSGWVEAEVRHLPILRLD